MTLAEIAIRSVSAAAVVTAVTLIARTKYTALSGVVLLFPAVSLVGLYFIGQTVDAIQLKQVTKYSIYALSTTFIFLVAFYYAQRTMDVPTALIASTAAWVVSAVALIGITRL